MGVKKNKPLECFLNAKANLEYAMHFDPFLKRNIFLRLAMERLEKGIKLYETQLNGYSWTESAQEEINRVNAQLARFKRNAKQNAELNEEAFIQDNNDIAALRSELAEVKIRYADIVVELKEKQEALELSDRAAECWKRRAQMLGGWGDDE